MFSRLTLAIAACFMFVATAFAQVAPETDTRSSAALAPKIADYLTLHGKQTQFNVGTKDEGVYYTVQLYDGHRFTVLQLSVYKKGTKSLAVDHYVTNQPLGEFASAADAIAYQLMMGTPKTAIEVHLHDDALDGVVDIQQVFTKKRGGIYDGFTREERDRGIRSGVGVKEFLLDGGHVFEKKRTRKATKKELEEAQEEYEELLRRAAQRLDIK